MPPGHRDFFRVRMAILSRFKDYFLRRFVRKMALDALIRQSTLFCSVEFTIYQISFCVVFQQSS